MATIAIVGRKNVGKSTIFNRLLGTRLSIVYKEPGVTRDRIYGEVAWCGRAFNIIDTGGFFPNEEIQLATKITRQIELALAESDLIYFVVDAKSGLTAIDEDIGHELRKINKPVFLLVNKVDNRADEAKALEFNKLGFSDTYIVSAEAGHGFGEILDATLKLLKPAPEHRTDRAIKILIIGRPNAGKSTLFNAILNEERAIVDEKPGTTRDLLNAKFSFKDKRFEIVDSAGIKKRSRITEPIEFYSMMRVLHFIDQANLVILIFDVNEGIVREDCRIAELVLSKAKGLVITANKIDLVRNKDRRKILPSIKKSLDFIDFAPVHLISARTRLGIEELLNSVLHVHNELSKMASQEALDTIASTIKPPPGGQVTRITQVSKKPPVFSVIMTVPVRESYVRYLRNTLRNYFGYAGVPILIRTKVKKI